jgi:DHA1 family bicyclomycin/chloramphenicol resistance-like MFS transporter
MAVTQLTLTSGILGLAIGQLLAGPLSDARGRRGPLLIGMGLFVIASLLCGLVPSVVALIGMRLVQGLAGAAGVVIALAVARDLYAGLALARCVALLMTVNFLAPIVAPVLGGQLLRVTAWQGLFVAVALFGSMLLLAAALGLQESLPQERRQVLDVAAILHVARRLLAEQHFVGYTLGSSFAFAAGIVLISSGPFVLQVGFGLSPQQVSAVLGVNALGLALVAQLGARLVTRVGPLTLLRWGVLIIAAAGVALLGLVLGGAGLAGLLPALFVITTSLGLIAPNATALALADTDSQTAGTAAALLGVAQFSIGALTAPLVGLASATSALPMAVAVAGFGLATLFTILRYSRSTSA